MAEVPAEIEAFAIAPATSPALEPPPSATEAAFPGGIKRAGQETVAALIESQTAAARGLGAISDEIAGLARAGIGIVADAATQMLGVNTISDACGINALFACRSFECLLDGSVRLSGLGVKLAAESSRPVLTQLGQDWIRAFRLAL